MPQPELGKAFSSWEKTTWSKIKRYEQFTLSATAAAGVLIAYEKRLNHGVETIREAWDGVPRPVWHCRHTVAVSSPRVRAAGSLMKISTSNPVHLVLSSI